MSTVSAFPTIQEEALADLRQRIGKDFVGPPPYLTEVTRDSIRHWADGIGDRNPLWRDEERAAASRWGRVSAPPTILYGFDRIVSGYVGGLPGVHAMFAGTDFRWRRAPLLGDRISATARLTDLIDRPSRFAGRAIQQVYRVNFVNQDSDLICEADSWCFRTGRDAARERDSYQSSTISPAHYSDSEIEQFANEYRTEHVRGADPRYWDDVKVGDSIGSVLKGPLTVTSMIAFDQGWGGLYLRGHGLAFDMFDKHPALGIPNSNNVPEPPERVHWDPQLATRVGVPGPYDYGPERVSWLGHLVTNWMSDVGFMRRLNVQVRSHNLIGDLTRCSGRVSRTWEQDGFGNVECVLTAHNQRGEVTAKGTAVVELPHRTQR